MADSCQCMTKPTEGLFDLRDLARSSLEPACKPAGAALVATAARAAAATDTSLEEYSWGGSRGVAGPGLCLDTQRGLQVMGATCVLSEQ